MNNQSIGSPEKDHLLVTIHGIRTFGGWQEQLGEMLEAEDHATLAIHYKFGYFSSIAFLIPFVRYLVVRRFAKALKTYYKRRTWRRVDIVAHSFGTYIAVKALLHLKPEDRPRVHTLILAGSVLKVNYPIDRLLDSCAMRIVNECGIRDNVLVLSQIAAIGTGMAGRSGIVGFQQETFQNRFYIFGHGGYFEDHGVFMRREWLPMLLSDGPIPSRPYPRALSNVGGALLFLINNADALKVTAVLAISIGGLILYQETLKADEIVRGFYQGDDKQEYAALWRLSLTRSDRVKKAVIAGLLKNAVGAQRLGVDHREIITALGLRARPFTALKGLLTSGPCLDLTRDYFAGCLTVARMAGDEVVFANRILDVLPTFKWKATDDNTKGDINIEPYSEDLSGTLRAMAPRLKQGQAALAARIADVIEKIGADDVRSTENLLGALEALSPQLPDTDREKLADRIVKQLSKADHRYALDLAGTLAIFGSKLRGNQLEAAMNRFIDLIQTADGRDLSQLRQLSLAGSLSAEQAERVDQRIVMLLGSVTAKTTLPDSTATGEEANLCLAEAEVAAEGKLPEARIEQGAVRTLEFLKAVIAQMEPGDIRLNQQGTQGRPAPPPQGLWPLTQAIGIWATVLNGRPAEGIANQLVELIPGAPGLASALAQLTPRLVGNQAELGSKISALPVKAQGGTAENLALALMALGAKTQSRSDQAAGFQRVLLQVKTDPNRVADLVSGTAAAYLSPGQAQQVADQVAQSLKGANVDNVGTFADAAFNLGNADQRNLQHLEFACHRIIALLSDGKGGQADRFGGLLAKLGSHLPHQEVEDFASQIAGDLSKAAGSDHPMSDPNQVPTKDGGVYYYPTSINLSSALAGLAAGASLNGGQSALGVSTILDLLEKAVRDKTEAAKSAKAVSEYPNWDTETVPILATKVKALAAHLTPNEDDALAKRILDLVSVEVDLAGLVKPLAENTQLMPVLVDLTPKLAGDQTALANRIEDLRSKASAQLMDQLSDALLGLAANADAEARKRILMATIGQPRSVSCDVAVAKAQSNELPLLVDMLKWPICPGFPVGIMLQIAHIKQADPAKFGRVATLGDSKTFTPDLPSFIVWLRGQKDDTGRSFDIEGPPMLTPMSAPRLSQLATANEGSGRSASTR